MSAVLKPVIIHLVTSMVTVACSVADIYGIFKPNGMLPNYGSDVAYWLCFGLLCWSLACTLEILRKLEIAFVAKLFWVGLAVLPFMILRLVVEM